MVSMVTTIMSFENVVHPLTNVTLTKAIVTLIMTVEATQSVAQIIVHHLFHDLLTAVKKVHNITLQVKALEISHGHYPLEYQGGPFCHPLE